MVREGVERQLLASHIQGRRHTPRNLSVLRVLHEIAMLHDKQTNHPVYSSSSLSVCWEHVWDMLQCWLGEEKGRLLESHQTLGQNIPMQQRIKNERGQMPSFDKVSWALLYCIVVAITWPHQLNE